jgi:hypothetical protein
MERIGTLGFVIVAIAAAIGVWLFYGATASRNCFGEAERPPLIFWLFVLWAVFVVSVAAVILRPEFV